MRVWSQVGIIAAVGGLLVGVTVTLLVQFIQFKRRAGRERSSSDLSSMSASTFQMERGGSAARLRREFLATQGDGSDAPMGTADEYVSLNGPKSHVVSSVSVVRAANQNQRAVSTRV